MRYYSHVRKKFKANEIIFSENTEGDGMYIIESGRVRVFKHADQNAGPSEIDLCTLGPNSMFGEMSIIDNGKRSASVQALEPTVCTVITRKMFADQLQQIPTWMVNMIRILVLRLRETNERLRGLIENASEAPADSGTVITVAGDQAEMSALGRERGSTASPQKSLSECKRDIISELLSITEKPGFGPKE